VTWRAWRFQKSLVKKGENGYYSQMVKKVGDQNISGVNEGAINLNIDSEQLLDVNRYECCGRLASGFIHDLNNNLGVLFGYLEMALEECDPNSLIVNQLKCVEKSADKVRLAVDGYHSLIRSSHNPAKRFDLVAVSRELGLTIAALFPSSVIVDAKWPGIPLMVYGKVAQWSQVLMNLLLFSRGTIPHGGTINLCLTQCRDAASSMDYASLDIIIQGRQIIDRQVQSASFVGLGLPSVALIVKWMGGQFSVDNAQEGGTLIQVKIPLDHSPSGQCLK